MEKIMTEEQLLEQIRQNQAAISEYQERKRLEAIKAETEAPPARKESRVEEPDPFPTPASEAPTHEPTIALTSDDISVLDRMMTGSDWLRIFRSMLERIQTGTFPNAEVLFSLCSLLMQTMLEDAGSNRKQREEIAKELTNCTPGELAALARTLRHVRGTNG